MCVCDWEPDVARIRNLPVAVSEQEIEEMFSIADTDKDQRISYQVGPASLWNIKIFLSKQRHQQLKQISHLDKQNFRLIPANFS